MINQRKKLKLKKLKLKITQKKTLDSATNTDVSFSPISVVLSSKRLIKDLKYLCDFNHTGTLEIYHFLYNKHCPKRLSFSYEGMVARSQLTHNSSIGLKQVKPLKNEAIAAHRSRFSKDQIYIDVFSYCIVNTW